MGGSSGGEDTIHRNEDEESDTGSPNSKSSPQKHANRQNHRHSFGIDDILLLKKITGLLDNGIECRQVLDAIINICLAMQNIHEAVLQYQKVINQQNLEPRVRRVALSCGAEMKRSIRLCPGRFFTLPDEAKSVQHQYEDVVMEARVRACRGSVLGKGSILKLYSFPGQKKSTSMGHPMYSRLI